MKADESNPKARGGLARAQALTSEERKAIARNAALARWNADIPIAEYEGEFPLGSTTISAAVLPNKKRIIIQATFLRALGRSRSPKGGTGVYSTVDGVPFFLQAEALKPFISDELLMSTTPLFYRTKAGGRGVGYDAELLPKVCEVYLSFRDWCLKEYGEIPDKYRAYRHIITACDILMRGLAHVGIIALVDEATGYQYDRARTALVEILEEFVAKELRKWVKTFQDEFYLQICRLRGWKLADINKRPMIFANLTNYLVYKRLAPGVLKELHRLTPKDEKGRRKNKLFQRLTGNVGHPRLRELLASEIVLMRIFDDGDWPGFEQALNRAIPIYGDLPLFDEIDGAQDKVLLAP